MEAVTVRHPRWVLTWSGKDVTRDIAPLVLQITYTDALHGESEDLSIQVSNADGRWLNGWRPAKGDALSLQFGYEGEALQPARGFQIDELEYGWAPDTLSIKAVTAGVTPSLRTKRSAGYDGTTLAAVARRVAGRHGLTLTGAVEEVPLDRVTQDGERDLAFLKRLGERHGYAVTVRGDQLVFARVGDLKAGEAVLAVTRSMVLPGGTLTQKSAGTYKAAKVTYHDPDSKALIEGEAADEGVDTGDTLRLSERVESPAQARARAAAALEKANRGEREGRLSLPGEPRLAAGVRVELRGFGFFDGPWLVEKATHTITRGEGYTTEIEIEGR